MESVTRYQLSDTTLQHFDFLDALYDAGVLDRETVEELAYEGLKGLPKADRDLIYPVTFDLVNTVAGHLREGKRRIEICIDEENNKYVEAES